jgi:tetratricopeptide (TPR) repeat protein
MGKVLLPSASKYRKTLYRVHSKKRSRCMVMKKVILGMWFVILLVIPPMDELQGQQKPRIVFDENYARWKPSRQLMDIELELETRGYDVEYSGEWMNSLSPSKYDALVLFIPYRYFHDEEKNAIREFVKNGGGLIIFGEHGGYTGYRDILPSINSISTMFGIEFNEDVVRDEEKNRNDNSCQAILGTFAFHPVAARIDEIGYICGCSLTLSSSARALAFGNRTTTAGEKKGKEVVVLAAAEYGKGKVLAIGDSDFLVGKSAPGYEEYDFLSYKDNKDLALNMFEWVISPKTEEAEKLASEGYTLFSQKEYPEAKLKFEEALAIYSEVNDYQGISEMQAMIDKCEKGVSAQSAHEKGMVYYNEKDYERAKQEFETSRNLYNQIGDSAGATRAQPMIDECYRRIVIGQAEAAYEKGVEYYDNESHDDARKEFQSSKSLYDQIGDSGNSEKAQEMIDACDKYITAHDMYEEGMKYFSSGKYEEALATFKEVEMVYRELGDTGRIQEVQVKIDEIEKTMEEQISKKKMMILFGVLIVVVAVFLVSIVFLRKPEVSRPSRPPLPGRTVYCPECGKENPIDATCCEYCGTPLRSVDELEKEKAIKTLQKKYAKGEISEEEYHETMEELKKRL